MMFHGGARRRAGGDVELAVDRGQVRVDRAGAQHELLGDLRVREGTVKLLAEFEEGM